MAGKNWNSKLRVYTNIMGEETLIKSKKAQELKNKGLSVSEIAKNLGLSESRIYEYLRK
jgi:predicted transcriptional regulator